MDLESEKNINYVINKQEGNSRQKYWIGGYAILAAVSLVIHYLIEWKVFDLIEQYRPFLKKISLTLFFVFLVFLTGRLIERLIDRHTQSRGYSYNLVRITRLLTYLFGILVVVSFQFDDVYATLVSFGILSLILGFALQSPISSFIAWLYIVFRTPYRVGDRIEINGFKGDVTEINYLDTTLLEFGGTYLSNDRLSGRIIRFPNSIILRSEVFNYSGFHDPFIWNETAIQIAYTSDLQFVEESLLHAARKDYIDHYAGLVPENKELDPAVYFRTSQYAWMEAVVSYPVLPTETTPRRTRILRTALAILNKEPGKVQFPEGSAR
ncbi:MAG: mechanosensitive ion channel domain-containing protein [Ginsengibacter sp.]